MFVRADDLWLEELEKNFRLHALEFHWDGFEPGLSCFDSSSGRVVEFDLEDVRFIVGKGRTCIGRWEGDTYIPCPKKTQVSNFSQCQECASESFIPFQECIFDPKCDGEMCDVQFCKREHVLYLAFYDTKVKVGMSSSRRVERRLVEQGADAFAIIGSFGTRKKARDAEKEISSRLGVPQAFRQEVLLENFARPIDVRGIEEQFRRLARSLREQFSLDPEDLRLLTDYPIDLPLREKPRLETTWGRHRGELLGIKGKWMVYESKGIKALSLADLPSRHIARDED